MRGDDPGALSHGKASSPESLQAIETEKTLLRLHHHLSEVVRVFQALRKEAGMMGEPIGPHVEQEAALLVTEMTVRLKRMHMAMLADAEDLQISLPNLSPAASASTGGKGGQGADSPGWGSPMRGLAGAMFSRSSEEVLGGGSSRR